MRQEISSANVERRSISPVPSGPLTDGVVTLRLPLIDDVEHIARYGADEALLDGAWISGPWPDGDVDRWARAVVDGLIEGWTPEGSIQGAAFVIDESVPFAGVVYVVEMRPGVVEFSWGVVPTLRRRGIASRAGRLATEWALGDGGFERVELRIADGHPDRVRVAENAGFRFEESIETYVTGTGETYTDLLYVCDATTR